MAKDPRYIKIINSQRWKILRANALASRLFVRNVRKWACTRWLSAYTIRNL